MRFGICLPNFTDLATIDSIEAAAELAERVGWEAVWTTDHVLIDHSDEGSDYRTTFDAIETLAWVGARHPKVRLGTSVIVVPQRNAVVLAKELATLDALAGGRVIAGVGVGWNAREFGNLGVADRFAVRGAYLDETIALWRHLWSGSTEPFEGRFHRFDDFVFGPLPAQGAALPIWVGGRAEAALQQLDRHLAAQLGVLRDGGETGGQLESRGNRGGVGLGLPGVRQAVSGIGPAVLGRVRHGLTLTFCCGNRGCVAGRGQGGVGRGRHQRLQESDHPVLETHG
jgi:hypothetical protein